VKPYDEKNWAELFDHAHGPGLETSLVLIESLHKRSGDAAGNGARNWISIATCGIRKNGTMSWTMCSRCRMAWRHHVAHITALRSARAV